MSFLHEPGDLARTPLAAILLEALNLRATGVLSVAHGGGTSRLYVRAGHPVGAQVFTGFRPLGHVLLQAGLIEIDALSRSLARMAEARRPHGEILVEMGAVSREDVERALAEQQAGYFSLIAALDSGAYAFDAGAPIPDWTRGGLLSPLRTIVDALERPQAAPLVVSALQPVAGGGVRLASGYGEVADAFRWTGPERALVARLEPAATLDTFFADGAVAPERARAVLAGLLLLGLALPAAERPAASGDTSAGLLLEDDAPGAPAAAPRRSDPAEARARRQRLLQRAIQNMGVGPFAGRPAGARPPSPGGDASAAAPSSAHDGPEAQLRSALLEMEPRAREADLFARLGLPRTAARDEVKRAYLALAKRFHPDRFAAAALADLHERVKDFFTAVNEAYEVLSDDRKRAEYLARESGARPADASAARIDFEKGEACLRTRDFLRARAFLDTAVRADPRPEYQAALAFACIADPHQRDRERARTLLDAATKDPRCDRAFYVAGILARDEGEDARAERMFRGALAANPRHVDAVRELRALAARRSR